MGRVSPRGSPPAVTGTELGQKHPGSLLLRRPAHGRGPESPGGAQRPAKVTHSLTHPAEASFLTPPPGHSLCPLVLPGTALLLNSTQVQLRASFWLRPKFSHDLSPLGTPAPKLACAFVSASKSSLASTN